MVHDRGPASANLCAQAGADTTGGGAQSFTKLRRLGPLLGGPPEPGDILMAYEEVEVLIDQSVLDPNLLALFRGPVGGPLTEYATGVALSARFEYRRGAVWDDRVTPGQLDQVDAVRIVAAAHQPSESGVGTAADFELTVDLPLRNR